MVKNLLIEFWLFNCKKNKYNHIDIWDPVCFFPLDKWRKTPNSAYIIALITNVFH